MKIWFIALNENEDGFKNQTICISSSTMCGYLYPTVVQAMLSAQNDGVLSSFADKFKLICVELPLEELLHAYNCLKNPDSLEYSIGDYQFIESLDLRLLKLDKE